MTSDQAVQATRRFSKNKFVREVSIDLAGKKKRMIEEFAGERQFKQKRRRVVSIYQTDDQAREAFHDRCAALEQLGFISVGG